MSPVSASHIRPAWLARHLSTRSPGRGGPRTVQNVPEAAEVAALASERVLRWCAIVGLSWRALSYPVALFQAVHEGGARIPAVAVAPLTFVLIGNIVLLVAILRTRSTRLLRSSWFCILDITVAVGLNLWSAFLAAPHSILVAYRDVFSVYAWNTVALWTALR